MRLKPYILAILFLLSSTMTLEAQTLQEGRNLFTAGKYDKARPIILKYLKQQPENGARNFWYGVCLFETGDRTQSIPYLEKAADKKIIKAYKYLGLYYAELSDHVNAIDCYTKFVNGMASDSQLHDELTEQLYTAKIDSIRKVSRMLKNTEKVCFIDSVVVLKDNLLKSMPLSQSCGSIGSYTEIFGTELEGEGYIPELGNSVCFSRKGTDGHFRLYKAFRSFNRWSDESQMQISSTDSGNIRYPFVMSDGVTLYYAYDGDGTIGGYDIFATRLNPETDRYLVPENIGMPFNSEANDYLYVIDEVNNLGWFATDRRQSPDSVCIYVFIPNESKRRYNADADAPNIITRAAKIVSIAETQSDSLLVAEARKRLNSLTNGENAGYESEDTHFIIDDRTDDYYSADDFRSPSAKNMFISYSNLKEQLKSDTDKLLFLRDLWATGDNREEIRQTILDLENTVEETSGKLDRMETDIRSTEIEYLSR